MSDDGEFADNLGLDDPREWNQALLTYANREFLYNPQSKDEEQWSVYRQRIRDRLKNALRDYDYMRALFPEDYETLGDNIDDDERLQQGVRDGLEFLYRLIEYQTALSFEAELEKAIARYEVVTGEERGYHVSDVSVNIDMDRDPAPHPLDTLEKFQTDENLTDAEAALVMKLYREESEEDERIEDFSERMLEAYEGWRD